MDTALFILIFYPTIFLLLICYVSSFFVHEETCEQKFTRWENEKKDYINKATIPEWDAYYTETNRNRQERLAYHPGNPNRESCIIV